MMSASCLECADSSALQLACGKAVTSHRTPNYEPSQLSAATRGAFARLLFGWLVISLFANPLQQNRCRFVAWVLRHEFAAEGFGEERGRELVNLRLRRVKPRLDLVRQRKQRFHPAHDFLLLGERRQKQD